MEELAKRILEYKKVTRNESFIETILEYAEQNDIDFETVDYGRYLVQKVKEEAIAKNLLKVNKVKVNQLFI